MSYVGHILLLAAAIACAFVFGIAAVGGAITGRLKSEPSQPWLRRGERPLRFAFMVTFHAVCAGLFLIASVMITKGLLR